MALIKIICPSCGKETEADDQKSFAFCTECGTRIDLISLLNEKSEVVSNPEEDPKAREILESGLKDAAFYLDESARKQEYLYTDKSPEYYEKAQSTLTDLSKRFPSDYRVWWELSKPLDFFDPANTRDLGNEYGISTQYFDKALDLADLDTKRKLIDARDSYSAEKNRAIAEKKKQAEIAAAKEKAEKDRIEAEKQAKEEEARKKQEEQFKAQQEERIRSQQEEARRQAVAREEARKVKESRTPKKVATILAVVAWISMITMVGPYIFGGVSISFARKSEREYGQKLVGVLISDILCMVLWSVIIIWAIVSSL